MVRGRSIQAGHEKPWTSVDSCRDYGQDDAIQNGIYHGSCTEKNMEKSQSWFLMVSQFRLNTRLPVWRTEKVALV
jgi:hypothetical protein